MKNAYCVDMKPLLMVTAPGSQKLKPSIHHQRLLTTRIKSALNIQDILDLLSGNRDCLNHIHAATAVLQASKILKEATRHDLASSFLLIVAISRHHVAEMEARGIANCLWAAATCGCARTEMVTQFIHALATRAIYCLPEFKERELSTVVYSLAKLHEECLVPPRSSRGHTVTAPMKHSRDFSTPPLAPTALLLPLLQEASQRLVIFSAQDLSITAWSLAVLGHHDMAFMDRLLLVIQLRVQDMTSHDFTHILYAVGRFKHDGASMTSSVTTTVDCLLHSFAGLKARCHPLPVFNAQQLCNCAWALAVLEYYECAGFISALLSLASCCPQEFVPQGYSNFLHALAKLRQGSCKSLSCSSVQQCDRYPPCRSLSCSSVQQCDRYPTKLEAQLKTTVLSLLQVAESKLPHFSSQNVANTLWALSVLERKENIDFITGLLRRSSALMSQFSAQDLSNTIWSLARLGHNDAKFIKSIIPQACHCLKDFTPQHLSNMSWSLAKLDFYDAEFLNLLLEQAHAKISHFKPQELSNLLWSLAELRHMPDDDLFSSIMQEGIAKVQSFTAQNLTNTLWAAAVLNMRSCQEACMKLLSASASRSAELNAQNLSNALWASAVLELYPSGYCETSATLLKVGAGDTVSTCCSDFLPSNGSQAINLCGCVPNYTRTLLQEVYSCRHDMVLENKRQVLQLILCVENGRGCKEKQHDEQVANRASHHSAAPQQCCLLQPWYQDLRRYCLTACLENTFVAPSFTQLEVLESVRSLPLFQNAVSEQLTAHGLLSIDIAVEVHFADGTSQAEDCQRIAIEVDGPSHFMRNSPESAHGATVLRNRMLGLWGWTVLSVLAAEWPLTRHLTTCSQRNHRLKRLEERIQSVIKYKRNHSGPRSCSETCIKLPVPSSLCIQSSLSIELPQQLLVSQDCLLSVSPSSAESTDSCRSPASSAESASSFETNRLSELHNVESLSASGLSMQTLSLVKGGRRCRGKKPQKLFKEVRHGQEEAHHTSNVMKKEEQLSSYRMGAYAALKLSPTQVTEISSSQDKLHSNQSAAMRVTEIRQATSCLSSVHKKSQVSICRKGYNVSSTRTSLPPLSQTRWLVGKATSLSLCLLLCICLVLCIMRYVCCFAMN
ncbi:hypothetical protein CEUSTIGMA_g4649.t1 [Chlamydomonas eustigma]|uniref:RAP domain-containing protein n=1 Tax=Chlamydomonas eustigma TaxID=1157962 RepID=A0A250X287_9CHLO|nr:hypothetical protein CEUSTIGMA_g4649.t1 [Chlamydomonas eustigma]|eukprot:GAX77203.1 hypothetical protein CEUSTIGMA_g4649.t1 [Chlamydomonas eustigma]